MYAGTSSCRVLKNYCFFKYENTINRIFCRSRESEAPKFREKVPGGAPKRPSSNMFSKIERTASGRPMSTGVELTTEGSGVRSKIGAFFGSKKVWVNVVV